MITAENLIAMYARNVLFIKQLTEGLTHVDSLAQPPVPGNCMNWVMGHIVAYRNRLSDMLGQPPALDHRCCRVAEHRGDHHVQAGQRWEPLPPAERRQGRDVQ